MEHNESLKFFMRFVQEKHDEVKKTTENLFTVLVREDETLKVNACQGCLDSAENLSRSLASSDRPNWLQVIIEWCAWYPNNLGRGDAPNILFGKLLPIKNQIINHKWSLGESNESTKFDFDELYERHKADSKLPELFDSLIDTLEKMIISGEIDSIKSKTSIQQLLSLLKQNKSGSYFSMMASWEFIGGFIKNTLWESLDLIPAVKQLKKGFEKTIAEMDIELEDVHNNISKEMKDKYNTAVDSLAYIKKGSNLLEHKKDVA